MDQDLTIFIAAWGIIIGGGLIALAGLNIFSHPWILKTRTPILALFAGIVILGAVEIRFFASSAAFLEAQKVVVSDCHLQAEAENPGKHGTQSDDINKSIAACLSQAGYEWSPEYRRCQEAPLAMNAFCYLPTRFFSHKLASPRRDGWWRPRMDVLPELECQA